MVPFGHRSEEDSRSERHRALIQKLYALARGQGLDRLNAMNENDRRHLEGPIRQRYIQEFATNGVASLEIVEWFGIGGGIPVKTSD